MPLYLKCESIYAFKYSLSFCYPVKALQRTTSSLVCADFCLNFHFSYTLACYLSFLLRHYSFSYVIVSQKKYTQDRGTICAGRGNKQSAHTRLLYLYFYSVVPPSIPSSCKAGLLTFLRAGILTELVGSAVVRN